MSPDFEACIETSTFTRLPLTILYLDLTQHARAQFARNPRTGRKSDFVRKLICSISFARFYQLRPHEGARTEDGEPTTGHPRPTCSP